MISFIDSHSILCFHRFTWNPLLPGVHRQCRMRNLAKVFCSWSLGESNPRPLALWSNALTTGPRAPTCVMYVYLTTILRARERIWHPYIAMWCEYTPVMGYCRNAHVSFKVHLTKNIKWLLRTVPINVNKNHIIVHIFIAIFHFLTVLRNIWSQREYKLTDFYIQQWEHQLK